MAMNFRFLKAFTKKRGDTAPTKHEKDFITGTNVRDHRGLDVNDVSVVSYEMLIELCAIKEELQALNAQLEIITGDSVK